MGDIRLWVEIREREAKGWVINSYFFKGLKLIQKAKQKLGAVFLGWHWRRKILLFLRVCFGAFVFPKELFVRWGGVGFSSLFFLFSKGDRRTIYGGGSENFLFPFPKGFILGDMRKERFDFFLRGRRWGKVLQNRLNYQRN